MRRLDIFSTAAALTLSLSVFPPLGHAQTPAKAPQPTRQLLLNVDGAPAKGNPNARLTLIEFSDYECPFCARYTRETWPLLEKNYVKTGKVRYVFRNFPIPKLHNHAMKAHEAALCAGEQGRYWEMHDLLFAKSPAIGQTALIDYAARTGLKADRFQTCLSSEKHVVQIRRDITEARGVGVTGTPTFFLGETVPTQEQMQPLIVLKGNQPYLAFKQAIDRSLARQGARTGVPR
jgi:protein-disulfide isomerase